MVGSCRKSFVRSFVEREPVWPMLRNIAVLCQQVAMYVFTLVFCVESKWVCV